MGVKSFVTVPFEVIRQVATKAVVTISILVLLLWIAVFLYGTFYYAYIPPTSHRIPINFQFSTNCDEVVGKMCSFPFANISFLRERRQSHLLMKGQPYGVTLEIDLPESEVNQKIGMFLIALRTYTKDGEVLVSAAKSTVLRFRSGLLQTLQTLFFSPFLVFGWQEQKQLLEVEFHSKYVEDAYKPTHGVYLEVQSKHIEIYSATLHIHAIFAGLRYVLYHWPLLSAVIGIGSSFFFLLSISALSWYQFIWTASTGQEVVPRIDLNEDHCDLTQAQIREVLGLRDDEEIPGLEELSPPDSTTELDLDPDQTSLLSEHPHRASETAAQTDPSGSRQVIQDITPEVRQRKPLTTES